MSSKTFKIAEALLHSKALKFGNFKLKSGVTSPYYIDLTWLLSSPEDFHSIINVVADEIKPVISLVKANKLASIELKGALLLPAVASLLYMPCVVVRKESKNYGLTDRITGGKVQKGDRIIFFDDVITSGSSKIEAISLIEAAGGKVEVIVVVVDREEGGKQELEKQGYKVKPITTISDIVKTLISTKALSTVQAAKILEYIEKNIRDSK